VRKDGSILRIAYSTAPFELPDGRGAVTAFTDIEDHLRADQTARERDVAAARAAELSAARRRIIEAADAARAQVTRDLHDGAQQQFVSALLTLQLAESNPDPGASARLRGVAVEQTRQGIAELRDLAAGLHPGVLTDRGLDAAVRALAERVPISVAVDAQLEEALPTPSRSASTSSSPRRSPTSSSTPAPSTRWSASASRTRPWSSRWPTTAWAAPARRPAAVAWPVWGTGSRRSTAPWTSRARRGRGRPCGPRFR
jgi:hypothetical protein